MRQENDCVGGIDSDPDDINSRYFASPVHSKSL